MAALALPTPIQALLVLQQVAALMVADAEQPVAEQATAVVAHVVGAYTQVDTQAVDTQADTRVEATEAATEVADNFKMM